MVETRAKVFIFALAVLALAGCSREPETFYHTNEISPETQAPEQADMPAAENLAGGQSDAISETELERDKAALSADSENIKVEKISRWVGPRESDRIWGKPLDRRFAEPEEGEACGEEQLNTLAAEYLKEQGFDGRETVRVLQGDSADCWQLECRIDEELQKICLLMRFYERGSGVLESVCCAVRDFAEAGDSCGTILVSYDEKQGTVSERYYDPAGKKCGEVSYLNRESMPFCFVTGKCTLEYFPWINRTTAFLEDYCEFDDKGTFSGTREIEDSEVTFHPYLSGACECIYGDDGRLTAIDEKRPEDAEQGELWTEKDGWTDLLSGQFTFDYDDSGKIRKAGCQRDCNVYGTWKSAGELVYDAQGRICYDSYFSTYGCSPDIDMYLYKENEERPFLYAAWSAYSADGFADIIMFTETMDTTETAETPEESERTVEEYDSYSCVPTEEGFELTFYSRTNEMIFYECYPLEPGIRRVTDCIFEVRLSVGSPAAYVFYVDMENEEVSETFFNPIFFGERYAAYMEDGQLILRDIFDKDLLYVAVLRDFSKFANPMSAVISIEMEEEDAVVLAYYQGEDQEEISERIAAFVF